MDSLLKVNSIYKSFGGVKAVQNCSLDLYQNDIVGIIGPNGAGKTTVFNLISGIYSVDQGEIILDGNHLENKKQHEIARLGISRTFQNIRLFQGLNAIENIMAACDVNRNYGFFSSILNFPNKRKNEKANFNESMEYLKLVGNEKYAFEKVNSLPYGIQRKIEIARALATKPRVLLLDEPAAGLNPSEMAELMDLIRKINRELGISILIIEHRMELIHNLCRYIYVLDFGKLLAEGTPAEIRNNAAVTKAYIGEED